MFDSKQKNTDVLRARLGDFVLFLTIVIATAANFSQFGFTFSGFKKITAVSILIYAVTTITYNHCFNKGKIEGKLDDGYLSVVRDYNAERDSLLQGNMIGGIQAWIDDYIKSELVEFRKGILIQYDLPYEEYAEKYLRMPTREILAQKMRLRMKRAIIKCNNAKPVSIKKADLLTADDNHVKRMRPIGLSGHRMENIDKASQCASRLAITLFSGAIGVDLVFNFSWVALIQWAIRMLPIFTALITGHNNGYKNITETEVGYKRNQICMIRLYKEWATKHTA